MGNLWGAEKKPDPKELMKQSERAIKRAVRDLDRERANLEKREKQMQAEIKKNAQKGQMVAARHIAKDVVRTRNQITKTYRIAAQLQSVQNKLTSMKATHATTQGMDKVCKAMVMINKQYDIPELNKMAQEFAIQSDKMDMMSDMTDDIIGDMLEGDADADGDEDAAADAILQSVMDAQGLKVADEMGSLPPMSTGHADSGAVGPQPVAMGASGGNATGGGGEPQDSSLAELEARMEALRRQD